MTQKGELVVATWNLQRDGIALLFQSL